MYRDDQDTIINKTVSTSNKETNVISALLCYAAVHVLLTQYYAHHEYNKHNYILLLLSCSCGERVLGNEDLSQNKYYSLKVS